jgi:hypothetical protein
MPHRRTAENDAVKAKFGDLSKDCLLNSKKSSIFAGASEKKQYRT